jgi:hypothetical protein
MPIDSGHAKVALPRQIPRFSDLVLPLDETASLWLPLAGVRQLPRTVIDQVIDHGQIVVTDSSRRSIGVSGHGCNPRSRSTSSTIVRIGTVRVAVSVSETEVRVTGRWQRCAKCPHRITSRQDSSRPRPDAPARKRRIRRASYPSTVDCRRSAGYHRPPPRGSERR